MRTKTIESSSNPIFRELSSLTSTKGINKAQKILLSGEKILIENLPQTSKDVFFVYHSEEHDLFTKFPNLQLVLLPKPLFKELDVVGTQAPLVCAPLPEMAEWSPDQPLKENEILCAMGDPNNLGALVRSASAFGIRRIVLLKESTHPFLPKANKASSGSNMQIDFLKGPSIHDLSQCPQLIALDMQGESIETLSTKSPVRLLIGQEGLGIPESLNCLRYTIPISKNVESLNATIAASIVLYKLSALKGI
jgi:RNA methyltransferase, TrmH family